MESCEVAAAGSSSVMGERGDSNKKMGSKSYPEIRVREDLERFFEVVDHAQSKLKCKLSGTDCCTFDGVRNCFKLCPKSGWYRFERHLSIKHKILVGGFLRKKRIAEKVEERISNNSGKQISMVDDVDFSFTQPKRKYERIDWEDLKTPEKYCFVCRTACPRTIDEESPSLSLVDDFPHTFLESENRLSKQLFVMFFLRDVIDFPLTLCEKFLKQCKGRLYPETWLNFCANCKTNVSEAFENRRKIRELEQKFEKTKKMLNHQVQNSCVEVEVKEQRIDPRNIEEQIRKYIRYTMNLQKKIVKRNRTPNSIKIVNEPLCDMDTEPQNLLVDEQHQDIDDAPNIVQHVVEPPQSSMDSGKRKRKLPGFYARIENFGEDKKVQTPKKSGKTNKNKKDKNTTVVSEECKLKEEPLSPGLDPCEVDQDADFQFVDSCASNADDSDWATSSGRPKIRTSVETASQNEIDQVKPEQVESKSSELSQPKAK